MATPISTDIIAHAVSTMRPERPTPRPFLTCREIEARYPRLLRAMRWVAVLSHGEARSCLRDYRDGFPFSGEAVNHFGGTVAVIRAAQRACVRSIVAEEARYQNSERLAS